MRDIITKLEQLNEGHMSDMAHEVEKDHEVQMARSDLYKAAKYAVSIHKMMKDVSEMEGIDGWVASKITKASDYLGSVKHYMEGQMMQDVELAVVPVAGDMTDAMTMPQESAEQVTEGRLGFRDLEKFGSAIASRIDQEARRRGSADMEPGDADELRYRIAKEMGLVESEENLEELTKAQQDRIDAAPGRTIDDMKPAERDSLKKFVKTKLQDPKTGQYHNQSEPAKQFYDKMGYNKLAKEEQVEEEDVIGNIIGKLAQGKSGQRGGKDVIGDIIAKLPKDKPDMPDMPVSKPTVPMQTKQKMANKMALPKSKPDMSMGQDKTTGDPRGILRQSKFAEWSKK